MILPASYLSGLLLIIAALLCAGSWASTYKASRCRYELYYLDFCIGVVVCALLAAFTFGSLRSSELTFQDNFLIAGYRKLGYAVAAGLVFNLGNLLLLAGVSVSSITLGFPLAFGIALLVDSSWDFALDPRGNALLQFGGAVIVLVAVVLISVAHLSYRDAQVEAARKAALEEGAGRTALRTEAKRKGKSAAAGLGIALGIVGGLILSIAPRLLAESREGDNGVAPYGLTLLFAAGVLLSTVVCTPFAINFPAAGATARIADYFRARASQHMLGLLGGILLGAAAVCVNVVIGSAAGTLLGPALLRGWEQSFPLLAMLWGMGAWREFPNSSIRVRTFIWGAFLLYAVGLAMISLAPLYGSK